MKGDQLLGLMFILLIFQ